MLLFLNCAVYIQWTFGPLLEKVDTSAPKVLGLSDGGIANRIPSLNAFLLSCSSCSAVLSAMLKLAKSIRQSWERVAGIGLAFAVADKAIDKMTGATIILVLKVEGNY